MSHLLLLKVTNLLKEVEFVIVPFVNPDGYEVYSSDAWLQSRYQLIVQLSFSTHVDTCVCLYTFVYINFVINLYYIIYTLFILQYTWTNDRLWRKNRRHVPGGSCDGVDLDRNYNYHWGDVSN